MPRDTMDPEDWRQIERARQMARQERLGCQSAQTRPWRAMGRLCAYCLAPLRNGSAYCNGECKEGHYQITMIWPED
jgi:hypothetical protein